MSSSWTKGKNVCDGSEDFMTSYQRTQIRLHLSDDPTTASSSSWFISILRIEAWVCFYYYFSSTCRNTNLLPFHRLEGSKGNHSRVTVHAINYAPITLYFYHFLCDFTKLSRLDLRPVISAVWFLWQRPPKEKGCYYWRRLDRGFICSALYWPWLWRPSEIFEARGKQDGLGGIWSVRNPLPLYIRLIGHLPRNSAATLPLHCKSTAWCIGSTPRCVTNMPTRHNKKFATR